MQLYHQESFREEAGFHLGLENTWEVFFPIFGRTDNGLGGEEAEQGQGQRQVWLNQETLMSRELHQRVVTTETVWILELSRDDEGKKTWHQARNGIVFLQN